MINYQGKVWNCLAISTISCIPLVLLEAQIVSAATLTYDLVDIKFDIDRGDVTGFFEIDQQSGNILSGQIITTSGNKAVFTGATYTDLTTQFQDSLFYLSANALGETPIFYRLFMTVDSSTIGNSEIGSGDFTVFEGARFGSSTGFTVGERIAISETSGRLVLRDSATAVPEPLTLLGTALTVGAGMLLRKKIGTK